MTTLNSLVTMISMIAAGNPDGFTFNLRTQDMQTTGFAIARAETQDSFGVDGLEAVINFCLSNDVECVGGWKDSKTGLYYFDATMIEADRKKAIALGRANNQIAIFDLDNLEEIRL